MFPFAQAAAELFNEDNSNVKISVGGAGTSGGFEKFCAGEVDIADASRPIEPEEVDACEKGGVSYTEIKVANDGISVTTNPALEISCLTTDQLKELWETPTVGNYSELGEDADTGQPLPDASVSLYGPGTDSGTFDYFTDVINGEEGVSRDDYVWITESAANRKIPGSSPYRRMSSDPASPARFICNPFAVGH